MNELELNKLLILSQSGDREAFGLLYDEFSQRIYKFIYVRTGHRQTAEDILADTFVKAWIKIKHVSSPRSFSGWLYQVAKNNIIDFYRAKKIILSLDEIAELEDTFNLIDRAELNLEQKRVMEAMERLPGEQAAVVKYKFFEELTNEEIAAIMGKTEVAVRVIQHRAITKLKKLLNT